MIKEQESSDFFPTRIDPIAPSYLAKIPEDNGMWIAESKLRGVRLIAYVNESKVRLTSREHKPTYGFPRIEIGLGELGKIHNNIIFDGEAVHGMGQEPGDERKASSKMASRLQIITPVDKQYSYLIFDLLYLNGRDLRNTPVEQRKELLKTLIPENFQHDHGIAVLPYVEQRFLSFTQWSKRDGFEGVVFKRRGSRYVNIGGARSPWGKIKFGRTI